LIEHKLLNFLTTKKREETKAELSSHCQAGGGESKFRIKICCNLMTSEKIVAILSSAYKKLKLIQSFLFFSAFFLSIFHSISSTKFFLLIILNFLCIR